MTVTDLRCEYLVDPVGLGSAKPRLSWILESDRRGETQTAYQIVVASRPDLLQSDVGDVWDTGRVDSPRMNQIEYEGAALKDGNGYFWKVRAWDANRRPSAWSKPARWVMGLTSAEAWKARWIVAPEPEGEDAVSLPAPFTEGKWIWHPGENALAGAPAGDRFFRRTFDIPAGQGVRKVTISLTADNTFNLFVNGQLAEVSDGGSKPWSYVKTVDITAFLKEGRNVVAVESHNYNGPAGVLGAISIWWEPGDRKTIPTDATWKSSRTADVGWKKADFDDGKWKSAEEIASPGEGAWGPITDGPSIVLPPAPFLRRDFKVTAPVKKALLHITALGLVEPRLNGRRVTNDVFIPGWTEYRKRVHSRTFEVAGLLQPGDNTLGAILAEGWASGYVGFSGRDTYGFGRPRMMAQLDIEYADGKTQTVVTDGNWKGDYGPVREADLLMGEVYDARKEFPGWDTPAFDAKGWRPAILADPYPGVVEPHPGVPVRPITEIKPISINENQPGVFIYDLGQNMVGWVRLRVKGKEGTRVRLRFGEVLNPDGSLYTTNLRAARCTDGYVLKGGAVEVWEPSFTFHGFRYVEVTGYPGKPGKGTVTGVVAHSDTPLTGRFQCSDPMINQLQHNIEWGQRGNFLEVPTDCPQRDERLGWMGDAQVFVRTACWNMDTAAFFTKWLKDVEDAQHDDGSFTDVAPDVTRGSGTAAWADAGVIVPWTVYQAYGDKRILQERYQAMVRYIDYLEGHSNNLIRPAEGYGDWLSINADTPKDVLATAYFAYSTSLMARIAQALGKTADARKYADLADRIKAAFRQAFVDSDGFIKGNTQTVYVLALQMDLIPDEMRPMIAKRLVNDIHARGWRLSTGFVGTGYLNPVLTREGHTDVAYRLLEQTEFPSWGFSIKHGATTIWERWDGWTPDRGFQDPGMNSFNHYSFGAVGQWMFSTVLGMDGDPMLPGFEHINVRPQPGGSITSVKGTYDSIRGRVAVSWRKEPAEDGAGSRFMMTVTIPANTTATVAIPAKSLDGVNEGRRRLERAEGVGLVRYEDGYAVCSVGSGTYRFTSELP